MSNFRNCECCDAFYESYTIGAESEITSFVRDSSSSKVETKGLCPFCNPKSAVWYNHKPEHYKESCRETNK